MTFNEFLERLGKLNVPWRKLELPWTPLRTSNSLHPSVCPICAVGNHIKGWEKYDLNAHYVGQEMGLDRRTVDLIVCASDGHLKSPIYSEEAITKTRDKILKAVQPCIEK